MKQKRLLTYALMLAAILALILPAIWNGYPLLFSDSGTYLASGHGNDIPVDRPIMYGLFVRYVSFSWSVWLVVLAHAILVFPLFPLLFSRVLNQRKSLLNGAATLFFLAVGTGMALFASQVMADIFAGAMVVAFIIIKEGNDLRRIEKIYLSILIIFSATTHLSHMGLLFGMVLLSFALDVLSFRQSGFRWRRQVWALSLALGAFVSLSGINYLYGEGFRMSRTRSTVMVSSLVDKGILQEYFQRHPEPESSGLYLATDRLPDAGWKFLWNDDSPLYDSISAELNWVGCWVSREEEFAELLSKVMADPVSRNLFYRVTGRMIIDQMKRFDMGILVPLDSGSVVFPTIREHYPFDMRFYTQSRQWNGTLEFKGINKVQRVVVYLSILIVLAGLLLIRRLPIAIIRSAIIIPGAYLGNAILVATLSTVDERYQARIAWLWPLLAIIVIVALAGNASSSKKSDELIAGSNEKEPHTGSTE